MRAVVRKVAVPCGRGGAVERAAPIAKVVGEGAAAQVQARRDIPHGGAVAAVAGKVAAGERGGAAAGHPAAGRLVVAEVAHPRVDGGAHALHAARVGAVLH